MRKITVAVAAAALAFLCGAGGYARIGKTFAEAETPTKLPDFTEDFEGYDVSGKFVEKDETLTKKWDNNVFRGGEPLGKRHGCSGKKVPALHTPGVASSPASARSARS